VGTTYRPPNRTSRRSPSVSRATGHRDVAGLFGVPGPAHGAHGRPGLAAAARTAAGDARALTRRRRGRSPLQVERNLAGLTSAPTNAWRMRSVAAARAGKSIPASSAKRRGRIGRMSRQAIDAGQGTSMSR
jgi:hypothetical protein